MKLVTLNKYNAKKDVHVAKLCSTKSTEDHNVSQLRNFLKYYRGVSFYMRSTFFVMMLSVCSVLGSLRLFPINKYFY